MNSNITINLKSFVLGAGLAISALGTYALAATLNTFASGDIVSSSKINQNFATLNTTKQDRVAGTEEVTRHPRAQVMARDVRSQACVRHVLASPRRPA